MATFITGTSL